MKNIIWTILALIITNADLFAQNTGGNFQESIGLNSGFSYLIMEQNQDLRKLNIFLEESQKGTFQDHKLIFGASLISIADYQISNTDSKFAYLMRHPTSNNQIGKEVSEAVVHSFQLSLSGKVNNWLGAYAEMLYNPEQSFGQGTITALGRNQVQLRKGMIILGDLNKFPLYGAIGKMDTPFGQTGSVSPFTNSTMWHAFGGLGYGAQVGFQKWNFEANLMAVQGGAQFRAMNTIVGDSTSVPSKLNNYVLDVNYKLTINENSKLRFGASYLHGSSYNQAFPVIHFEPGVINNPATTYYGKLNLNNRFILKGGFATTMEEWPGTHNPIPPLFEFEASKVTSKDIGAKYNFNINGETVYSLSGEFSDFRAGPDGSPWERQNQYVLGLQGLIKNSSKLFIELFRTEGYSPLNFISGGNMAPGETHSDRDARSHGIVIGGQLSF